MAVAPDLSILGNMGSIGSSQVLKGVALLGVFTLVMILIGAGVFLMIRSKKFYITIELYKAIDGQNKFVKKFKAMDHKIGRAGDKLWYVAVAGKYIAPGTLQSGPNVYKYYEREDGEWINFAVGNVDEQMKRAGVKYIDHDMRAQRIAISKALEAELKNQGFWEKYGATIAFILEILIFGVACVIIFYQFGEVVTKFDQVAGNLNKIVLNINNLYSNMSAGPIAGTYRPPIYIPTTG